jgi:hypothetical protein
MTSVLQVQSPEFKPLYLQKKNVSLILVVQGIEVSPSANTQQERT